MGFSAEDVDGASASASGEDGGGLTRLSGWEMSSICKYTSLPVPGRDAETNARHLEWIRYYTNTVTVATSDPINVTDSRMTLE